MTDTDNAALAVELERLHKAATPAPWFTLDPPWLPSGSETSILAGSPDPHVARFICDFDMWALDDEADAERKSECPDADAELIVALRNNLPAILSALRERTHLTAPSALREALGEYLAERDEDQWCQRLKHGQCSLRKCSIDGGWTPGNPPDFSAATCARYRLEQALASTPTDTPAADAERLLAQAIDRIEDMLAGDDGEAWAEARKFVERVRTLTPPSPTSPASGEGVREKVLAAIKVTQYKYFGDYEFSKDQAEAVETLVDFALAALSPTSPTVEEAVEACAKIAENFEPGPHMVQSSIATAIRNYAHTLNTTGEAK